MNAKQINAVFNLKLKTATTVGLIMKSLKSTICHFSTAAKRHLLALHRQCDPMVTLSNKEEGRNDQTQLEYLNKVKCHRRQFLFPLIIILLTSLFGTLGMQAQNGLNFTLSSLISSPVIFTHKVIQVAIWRQMDVAIGLDVVISLLVFGALVVTPAIGRKYQLTVNQTKDSSRTQVFLGYTSEYFKCAVINEKQLFLYFFRIEQGGQQRDAFIPAEGKRT